MRAAVVVAVVLAASLFAACGSSSSSGEDDASAQADERATAAADPAPATSAACDEPDGQEKASLRFAVRAHDRELKDAPWALVRKGGTNYMAAEIDAAGPRLVVLVSFPEEGAYLSGMKAVNGTARTFTDLPEAGDRIPKGGEQALDCVG